MNSILNATAQQLQTIPSRLRNAIQFQNHEIVLIKKVGFSLIGLGIGTCVGKLAASALLSIPKVDKAFMSVRPLLQHVQSCLNLGIIITGISLTHVHRFSLTQSTAITLMAGLGFLDGFLTKIIESEPATTFDELNSPIHSITRNARPVIDGMPA